VLCALCLEPFFSIFADNNVKTMNIVSAAPVTLSASAVEEIKRLMELEENQNKFLRVGVKGGGCSGLSYVLGFDQKQDSDEVYEIGGIPVIMNNAHGIYLMGMEIDWQDGLNARGFSFHNPNASTTCGCGTSFAV
jgi:iron-sulfur cluster assembly protein